MTLIFDKLYSLISLFSITFINLWSLQSQVILNIFEDTLIVIKKLIPFITFIKTNSIG